MRDLSEPSTFPFELPLTVRPLDPPVPFDPPVPLEPARAGTGPEQP